jgi:predicted RNA methylase
LLNFINNLDVDLDNKKVLDLGCGAGIIGIFACLKGARTVFQDYVKKKLLQYNLKVYCFVLEC